MRGRRAASLDATTGWCTRVRDSVSEVAHSKPETIASCTSVSAAATGRFNSCDVWRKISTSIVARAGPASSSATPNDVKVNRKTRVAAPTIEGRASGSSTSVNRRIPVAPISAATSSKAGSSCAQNPPTTRTTTARLKKTCAANRAANEGRGPANAAPTTTVGSTNATSVATRKVDRPGNRKRASR